MSAEPKITQLDLFINEQKELENKMKVESEASTKRQLRLLMHHTTRLQKRADKQEELIQSLVEYILEN